MTDKSASPDVNATVMVNGSEKITKTLNLFKEYVASSNNSVYTEIVTTLDKSIDDLMRDFGADVYKKMMLDPEISSDIDTLVTMVIGNGLTIAPFETEDQQKQVLADEIYRFCKNNLDNMITPMYSIFRNMLKAMVFGNKVAEIVWKVGNNSENGKIAWIVEKIKVKEQDQVSFVVDNFNNLVGISANTINQHAKTGVITTNDKEIDIMPLEKFWIYTFHGDDSDPRGVSILRSVYMIWWIKQQIIPEWIKYLAQFSSAIIVATMSDSAISVDALDANGNPIIDETTGYALKISPQEVLANVLQDIKNGSAAVLPHGTGFDIYFSQGNGEAFLKSFEAINQWISKTLLHQTLATSEGKTQARAAASVHKDILDLAVSSVKNSIAESFNKQVLAKIVEYNYGPAALELTPHLVTTSAQAEDFASAASAIATLLEKDYIAPEQIAYCDTLLGLPARSSESMQRIKEKYYAAAQAQPQQLQGAQQPQDQPGIAPDQQQQQGDNPASFADTEDRISEDAFVKALQDAFSKQSSNIVDAIKIVSK